MKTLLIIIGIFIAVVSLIALGIYLGPIIFMSVIVNALCKTNDIQKDKNKNDGQDNSRDIPEHQ